MRPQTDQSKRQRLFRNSIYSVISWIVPILPTLVITPIVIERLGNDQYGLYVIVLGFTGYFFTLNIGKAVTKFVAEYRATGETEKISSAVSATLLFSAMVGLAATITIAIFAVYFVSQALQIPADLQGTAVIALYLGCLNILVNMLGVTLQSVLQGLQRFDAFMLVTNLTSILLAIGTLTAVIFGYGVIGLFIASLTVSVITVLLSAILVKRILPELELRLRVGGIAWSEVWRYGTSIMAYQLFGSVLLIFERSWITRQFGPEALTFYVVPMTLAVYLQAFVASLVLAIFPVINEHLSQREIVAELYRQATRLILIILGFAGVSAIVTGKVFLGLWLDYRFADLSYNLLLIHVFIFSLVSLTMIVWQIAESFRSSALTATANFTWMALSIPLMILFSHQWQVNGVAYGRLVGVAAYVPLILYVERNFLGSVFWSFWISVLSRLAIAAALAGLAEYIVLHLVPQSWLGLAISISAGGIVFVILLSLLRLVGVEERSMLRHALFKKR